MCELCAPVFALRATTGNLRAAKAGLPTEAPKGAKVGAGEGIRTLDPDLGKVVLYP